MVGFYTDVNANVIGFVGTPIPEPASFTLLGAGLLGIMLRHRRKLNCTSSA